MIPMAMNFSIMKRSYESIWAGEISFLGARF